MAGELVITHAVQGGIIDIIIVLDGHANAPVVTVGLLAHVWYIHQRLQDYTSRTHQKG